MFAHVETSLEAGTPELKAVHESLKALCLQYLIVGDMPEAVSIFLDTHDAKYGVHPAIKFADTNVGSSEGFLTYPLYALGFIDVSSKPLALPRVEVPAMPTSEGQPS